MSSFDPGERELCVDGACIGVIGADGKCKECGLPGAAGASSERESDDDELEDGDEELEDEDEELEDEDEELEDEDEVEDDDELEDKEDAVVTTGLVHREPDNDGRELCVDGACIGVIGPHGLCKECGLPGKVVSLNPRIRGLRSEDDIAAELEANIATSDIAAPPPAFDSRQLCPDGTCIGIIGADGCCRECGARAEATTSRDDDDERDDDDDERDDDDDERDDDDDERDDDDELDDDDGELDDNDGELDDDGDDDEDGDPPRTQ